MGGLVFYAKARAVVLKYWICVMRVPGGGETGTDGASSRQIKHHEQEEVLDHLLQTLLQRHLWTG